MKVVDHIISCNDKNFIIVVPENRHERFKDLIRMKLLERNISIHIFNITGIWLPNLEKTIYIARDCYMSDYRGHTPDIVFIDINVGEYYKHTTKNYFLAKNIEVIFFKW